MKTGETLPVVFPSLITVVTSVGAKEYKADRITLESIHVQGDPYEHWIGRDKHGAILWTLNCLIPCIVEYPNQSKP